MQQKFEIFAIIFKFSSTFFEILGIWGMMSHNYRIYGSIFLLLEVIIVAMGVRFVQLLAPVCLNIFKNFKK